MTILKSVQTNFFSHKMIRFFSIVLFLFALNFNTYAEIITDQDFGFSLDIPEGYELTEQTQDGMSLLFSHPNIPVTFIIKIVMENKQTPSSDSLKKQLNKLSAQYDVNSFSWSQNQCSIASFKMVLDQGYEGWAVCAPLKIADSYLTLMCYAPSSSNGGCEQFIISTLNSLNLEFSNNKSECGIFTTFAFPHESSYPVTLNIGGNKIDVQLDKCDFDASQFIVDLEFSVLKLYANHKMWKEAWQRYYRRIYADNSLRLYEISKKIYKELYPLAKQKNPDNPDIAFAQFLLSWVQTFEYKREQTKNSSDFTPLPKVLCGTGNDCDSRSMLIAVILNNCNYDAIMLISREYSHAMVAVNIPAPGQTYYLKEKDSEYIFGETTAQVTWGLIAQNQSDRTKWIPVDF